MRRPCGAPNRRHCARVGRRGYPFVSACVHMVNKGVPRRNAPVKGKGFPLHGHGCRSGTPEQSRTLTQRCFDDDDWRLAGRWCVRCYGLRDALQTLQRLCDKHRHTRRHRHESVSARAHAHGLTPAPSSEHPARSVDAYRMHHWRRHMVPGFGGKHGATVLHLHAQPQRRCPHTAPATRSGPPCPHHSA